MRGRGQSAVEFALVLPLLFMLTLGIVDVALLAFSVALARGAATDAAQVVAEVGTQRSTPPPAPPQDADDRAVALVKKSAIASLGFVRLDTVEVCKLGQDLSVVTRAGRPLCDVFDVATSTWVQRPPAWDPPTRVNTDRCADYFELRVNYQYNWVTGGLLSLRPPRVTSVGRGRLEPFSYDSEGTCA